MMILRKNIRLSWVLLSLFLVQAFAPVALASTASKQNFEQSIDGIVICTTTGLKILTPQGDLVPVGEHDQGLAFEHCHACFTSTFFGKAEPLNIFFVTPVRVFTRYNRPPFTITKSASLVVSPFAARAPPV